MNETIEINHLIKRFGDVVILNDCTYKFPKKGLIGLSGQSGSGKSTLLNIISGLDTDYYGSVKVLGKSTKKQKKTSRLKNLGYVFQNYNLFEVDNVFNNVLMIIDSLSNDDKKMKRRKCFDLLNYVGLKKKMYQQVNTLSGGEKQRVCIARSLANCPSILLCDEPTGSLDDKNANIIFSLLKSISEKILVIVASHDHILLQKYCTEIIDIQCKKIVNIKCESHYEPSLSFVSIDLKRKKRKPRFSLSFLFSHTINIFKAKKWRTILCCIGLILGLSGLGISTYISECIGDEITNVFDSFIPKNQIVMTTYNQTSNPIERIYSAPLSSIENLISEYPEEIKDYGISYIVNYEDFFADKNQLYVKKGSNSVVIPSFSARTANDFLWLDDYSDFNVFPKKKSTLENDEIIIGLPYSDMINLCYGLQILRNYEALGDYINNKGLQGIYSFANYSWQYEDEQIFNIVGVVAFSKPTIFHSNHRWNEFLFEESMRFPSNDYSDTTLPWILNKVYYLETVDEISPLIKSIRSKQKYYSLVFEPPSSSYEMTHCTYGEICNLKRVYVYICDKNSVPYIDILNISNTKGIDSKVISTSGSYFAYPDSLMIGFAQKFFLSSNIEYAANIVDAYSTVRKESSLAEFQLPYKSIEGTYLKTMSGGLKISTNLSLMSNGEVPISLDEILISKSLKEKWNSPSTVYCAAQIGENEIGDYIQRDFRIRSLKVTGYTESTVDTIYVRDDWTIDFFRDYLGMSSFYLEPTGAVFEVNKNYNIDDMLAYLSSKYPQYKFTNPNKLLEESIESTTDYIGIILSAISGISLSISVILFITVIAISIQENEKEALFLHKIGISNKDVARIFAMQCLLLLVVALIVSSFSISFAEIFAQKYIAQSFGIVTFKFSLNVSPLILMGFVTTLFASLNRVGIGIYFRRKLQKM